jgi:hypothetical protein
MKFNKILLLHGPILSNGINFLTADIYRTPQERKNVRVDYDAKENIRSLSILFKKYGFIIVYSGWEEDEAWLKSNESIFDGYCISSQNSFKNESDFLGEKIQNNKEKFIAGCLSGINHSINLFGLNNIVVRMRSDIAVDVRIINEEILKIVNLPKSFLIEYADPKNIFFVPDFIFISYIDMQLQVYQHLYEMYKLNSNAYHLSHHIDLGATFLKLKNEKNLEQLICMSQSLHESMIWRGIPRYYQKSYISNLESYYFNCLVNYPMNFTIEDLIRKIPPELSGKIKIK